MIEAYKCFNEGLVNQYGIRFEPGVVYHADGVIKFHENGFHMCINLEDTLRYFNSFKENIDIAKVYGFGNVNKYDDEYNEYFDMYATEFMIIDHILTREEIINYTKNISVMQLNRFLSLYKLTAQELEYFLEVCKKDCMLMSTINYYQSQEKRLIMKKIIV